MTTNRRSTIIIALGIAVFILGGALLFLVLRNGKTTTTAAKVHPAAVGLSATTVPPSTPSAAQSAAAAAVKIPTGETGLALEMSFFNGGGGYIQTDDPVDIYAISKGSCPATDPKSGPTVALVASNVKVLSALGSAPAVTGQPPAFLLAVSPQLASELIFDQTFNSLYFTKAGAGQPPASATPTTCTSALQPGA